MPSSRLSSPFMRSQLASPPAAAGWSSNGGGHVVVMEEDLLQDETLYFERNRIQQLKDERRDIQKKTFTKWCNSYLGRARLEIGDLFTDLGDGILLMKFLEIISGDKLGKPNRGRMRVQKIENLNRCLEFLKQKRIQLENIGAEDIADGNERLILGLVWTIILRFTIENIEIETKESGERKHAKEALLLWCQRKTAGYPNVRIDNFSSSWRSGLAFCALIHAHHPELLNFDALSTQDPISNLNLAFDTAERRLDIARLLDAEDVNVACPDEKSVITYVSLFYHCFAKQKSELTGARRVAKVVGELVQQDRLREDHEQLAANLLCWIHQKCGELADRQFPNSLGALRELLAAFNRFRKEEKPPKYKEKGELEAQFFAIQTKRKASRRKAYMPPEGLGLHDLESGWAELERAEHGRQGALIGELQRQERLEMRAQLFYKKAEVRDAWLREMSSVLVQFESQPSPQSVEAGLRLLRNILAEALPKTIVNRFGLLAELSAELQRENFHGAEQIRLRERDILARWNAFLALLARREAELGRLSELGTLLGELDELGEELAQLEEEQRQRAQETAKHLAAVDEQLRRHELVETNVRAKLEWLGQLGKRAREHARAGAGGTEQLGERMKEREKQLDKLQADIKQRKGALQRARELFQFVAHWEEQRGWLADRLALCRLLATGRDLSAMGQAQRVHKTVEGEMGGQWERTKLLIGDGERLGEAHEVHWRLEALQKQWEELRAASGALHGWLSDADRLQQYFQDANEAESWIRERVPLARSEDHGRDINTAESQWRRHRQLEKEIHGYRAEMQRLDGQAGELAQVQFTMGGASGVTAAASSPNDNEEGDSGEEVVVPKVVVLYPYSGGKSSGGMSVARGEELALIDSTNKDWWRVLSRNGTEGYVPVNYCELIPEETVTVTQPPSASSSSTTKGSTPWCTNNNNNGQQQDGPTALGHRQRALNADYRHLNSLAERRGRALEEALNLFKFLAECRHFEAWAKSTGQALEEPVDDQEHLLALQEKFQKIRDEVRGQGQVQLDELGRMAGQLLAQGHSRAKEVLGHKEHFASLWAHLQTLLERKAAELERAQRLWQFNEQCADTQAWLAEKRGQLQKEPRGQSGAQDLRALQAAQRRLQNLERDLRPLADRMKGLWANAEKIGKEWPDRAEEVGRRVQQLEGMHAELLAQAREWIEEAERSRGQQMFEQAASELLDWTKKCQEQMLIEPLSKAALAEEVLRRHAEVKEKIEGKQFEFGYVEELGKRLMGKGQPRDEVEARLMELERARAELEQHWERREAECRQLLDWQAFAREADRIISLSRGQLAFLELPIAADSVEKVQNLLKGQAQFEARLAAQEERVLAFASTGDRLVHSSGHGHSAQIEQQKMEVIGGHERVLDKAQQRRGHLERALALEGLRRDADELDHWMGEKAHQMEHQQGRQQQEGAGGLRWAQTRHQAFVLELASNRAELGRLKKAGIEMVDDGLADQASVAAVLEPLEREWCRLETVATHRGDQLREEEQRVGLLEAIREAAGKMEEIEAKLANRARGTDLRGVKELLKQKGHAEAEIQLLEAKLGDISTRVQQMRDRGHFAAGELSEQLDRLIGRFQKLQDPLARRRAELDESLSWHQLAFDADVELQWIGEKVVLIESQQLGRSLTEAQQLAKRQEQLNAEMDCHQPRVRALLEKGKLLASDGHICRSEIEEKGAELAQSWAKLEETAAKRRRHFAWSLDRERLLFDLTEAENWLSEKWRQLEAREEAAEERTAAQALLSWVRALQKELGPYKADLVELRRKSAELAEQAPKEAAGGEEGAMEVIGRQARAESQMAALEHRARAVSERADARLGVHLLEEEQQELEEWLEQQTREAAQAECGANLEQWTMLRAKFDDRRQQMRLGQERLEKLETEAGKLLERAPEHAREIVPRQNRLRAMWELLGEYLDQREAALLQAEAIHRFWRDVDILEERLTEKKMALPNELGKDAKQAYGLMLKHEIFENEVAQVHAQLEALLAKGTQFGLDEGGQLRPLAENWAELLASSLDRRQKLMASYETHKFSAQVRDLLQWTQAALAEMGGEQMVRDLQTAEWLAEEHRRLRAELEGREGERVELCRLGEELVKAEHCASKEVNQRLGQLGQAFGAVRKEWALKADWLEQAVQWHAFQREALQILGQIQARDRALDGLEQRGCDSSECHQRELGTLLRVLGQLEDRVERLEESAEALAKRGHAELEQIQALARRVLNALNELGEHSNGVKRTLDAAQSLARFEVEMAELFEWLKDKEGRLMWVQQAIGGGGGGVTLGDKLDRLKKQQALQSELAANGPRLNALKAQMDRLGMGLRGPEAAQTIARCQELLQRWANLLARARALDAALEEAKELLDLEQLADRICAFVRAKEALVQAEELGEDMEHCQALLGHLGEDQSVDEGTLEQTNALGRRLLAKGSAEVEHIRTRLGDINEGWARLGGRIQAYRALLESALEVHRFNGEVDETNQRIGEKAALLGGDELGKELSAVERLIRAQDQVERDMSAIHCKLNEHDEQAKQLLAQEPPLRETILESLRKLELSWQRLAELAHGRRQALQQSLALHRFLDAVRRMEQWAQAIRVKMGSGMAAGASNVEEAERALQRHAERQAEIGARDEELRALREFGQKLAQEQPEHRSDLQRAQRRLQTLEHQTRQFSAQALHTLERALQMQKLLAQLGQIDCWLASKQAQLDGLGPGDSPESAEAALRELAHFAAALVPQVMERMAQLDAADEALKGMPGDAESGRVGARVAECRKQCAQVGHQTETKRRKFNGAKRLAQFLRECAELMTWMNAKLQLAMDDGYLDATALRLKLQKHLAFDAELKASKERIERAKEKGQQLMMEEEEAGGDLLDEGGGDQVRVQMDELTAGWEELMAKSAQKGARLRHAYAAHQLGRRVAEVEMWMERMEAQIGSEDHGNDSESAEQLLEHFEMVRAEIGGKRATVEELVEEAHKLEEEEEEVMDGEEEGERRHLVDRANALQHRWEAMGKPCQIRTKNLTESVQFHRWADQADEQMEWLEGKVRALESNDYGKSLHAAQSLVQKHQILEQQFAVRQPGIVQLVGQAEKMVAEAGGPTGGGAGQASELTHRMGRLQDLAALFGALAVVRAKRLTESLHSQEFYAEAAEAEQWMRERLPSLAHLVQPESGGAAETQLRRINGLDKEIDTFGDQLKRLCDKCDRMVRADHFDLTGLQARHCQLQELFAQLRGQCRQRRTQIANSIRYFGFVRRADELLKWLRERLAVAEREDYGQDLEECEQLAQQFQQVVRELAGAGERVAQVLAQKEELLMARHPNAGSIGAKGQDVQQLWREVNEATNERQQALLDGKNIHLFDQKADELLERLAEKEAHLLAMGDEQQWMAGMEVAHELGQMERQSSEFMSSLEVLAKQVDELCAEADRIVDAFPRTLDHLEVRRGELVEQLKDVREGAARQAERLAQAQANHQYFQEFRELMAWARQMQATLTGELLPRDVTGSEALLGRHREYRREIGAKEAAKAKFIQRGEQMLAAQGNALGVEIRARIGALEEIFAALLQCWHRRQQIYEDNADLQKWLASASELERWLAEREQLLREDWTGLAQDSVEGVEHQIRHFDDFLATLEAQGSQFEALKRMTRVEQNWERLRGQEKREKERREQKEAMGPSQQPGRRETQPIRTLEKKKMLQEKRQERERRKTQEISLMGSGGGRQSNGTVAAHSMHSSDSAHSGTILPAAHLLHPPASSTLLLGSSSQTLPRARPRASSSSADGIQHGGASSSSPQARLSIEIVAPPAMGHGQMMMGGAPPSAVVSRRAPSQGRTPGFTTRRTQSIRRSRHWDDLRSVDIHGYLDRKQELQAGGKRATFRSWKGYYSILCGQLLCFFKDEHHFMENMAASAPLALHGSQSALCSEYVKRRYVFKLNTADGAEFLFAAPDQLKALEWVDKLNFRAQLAPADQLLAFRPTTSEPLAASQRQQRHIEARSQTLEPRPKQRRGDGPAAAPMMADKQQNGGGDGQEDYTKSATLDPRKIGGRDGIVPPFQHGEEEEGAEEEMGQQKFLSRISVGEDEAAEGPDMAPIINGGQNGAAAHLNGQAAKSNGAGGNDGGENRGSIRSSGGGGEANKQQQRIGAFSSFLRRSSAAIGGTNNKKKGAGTTMD